MEIDGNTYVEISATGHNLGKWVETQTPTCTAMGREQRVCENCDHFETRNVEAFGHDRVEHPAQSATCTEIGWEAYEACSRCEYSTCAEIPQIGHRFGTWFEFQAATCTANGEERRNCSNCEHYEARELETLGHTDANNDEICDLCEKNLSADSTTDDNDGLAPVAFLLQNTTNGRKILK
ncbi:MAG: hypothetical protein E7584_01135 [Ruminococcaceae bacterium]|nr:hypothetical protein [Oscillospiraceae bacterium]